MYRGYRIVGVMPAGRRAYMELSLPYILDKRELFDEFRLWVNTVDEGDLAYMDSFVAQHEGWARLQRLKHEEPNLTGVQRVKLIRHFFLECTDEDTIYVRFDDDICWVHPEAIQRLLDFRIDHPEFFLVYPAIVNNGRSAYLHQTLGLLPARLPGNKGPLARRDDFNLIREPAEIGEIIHTHFLESLSKGETERWMFPRYVIRNYEKVSINCIAWFGSEFAKFGGVVGDAGTKWQEEAWLTQVKPKVMGKPSCIVGTSLMAHFAFHTQRAHLEQNTNLLQQYRIVCAKRHHHTPVCVV